MRQRKHYTAEQKVIILRELLENNVPISQLAGKYEVRPNDIYNWNPAAAGLNPQLIFSLRRYRFQNKHQPSRRRSKICKPN